MEPDSFLTSPAFLEVLQTLGIGDVDQDAFQMLEDARQLVMIGEMTRDEYDQLKEGVAMQLKQAAQQLKAAQGGSDEGGIFGSGGARGFGSQIFGKAMAAPKIEVPVGEKPMMEGELLKAPISNALLNRRYQKRWIVLYRHCLLYYNKKGDHEPKGRVDLTPDFFVQDSDAQTHGFVLSDMNITVNLAADSQDAKMFWMHMLAVVLRKIQEEANAAESGDASAVSFNEDPEKIKQMYETHLEKFKKSKQNRRQSMFFRKKKELDEAAMRQATDEATAAARKALQEAEQKRQQELEKMQEKLREAEGNVAKYRTQAEEERERAEREAERAEVERAKAEEAERRLNMSLEEWQAEARARENELRAQRDEIEKQLLEAQKRRRKSMMPGAAPLDSEAWEKERTALETKLKALQQALDVDLGNLEWDGTLEDAEEKMKALVPRLCSEDAADARAAQAEFDQWDKIIRNHADYKKREEEKWVSWEEENRDKNMEALREMKKYVPPEVLTGLSKEFLMDKIKLTAAQANRVMKTKIFLFYYLDKDTIAKTHIADLSSRYVPQGLDIVELRAVYACLPEQFELDQDGRKKTWREQCRAKLHQMTQKEKDNTISRSDQRNAAWRKPGDKGSEPAKKPLPGGPKKKVGNNAAAAKLGALFAGRGGGPPGGGKGPAPAAAALNALFAGRGAGPPGGGGGDEDEKKPAGGGGGGFPGPGGPPPHILAMMRRGMEQEGKAEEPDPPKTAPKAASKPAPAASSAPPKVVQESAAAAKKAEKEKDAAKLLSVVKKSTAGKKSSGDSASKGASASAPAADSPKAKAKAAPPPMVDIGVKFNAPAEQSDSPSAASGKKKTMLLSGDTADLMAKVRSRTKTGGELEGEVAAYDFTKNYAVRKKTWVDDGIMRVAAVILEHGKYDQAEGGEATLSFGEIYKNFDREFLCVCV